MNTFRIAELWAKLMTELGYDRFAAQGGDFGASVSTILGLRHPQRRDRRASQLHSWILPALYGARHKLAPIEQQFLDDADRWYARLRRLRPPATKHASNRRLRPE